MIKWLLKKLVPVVKFFGRLHLPYTHKQIGGEEYYMIREHIHPGDIILSQTFGEFSNLINPSQWKHAAVYVGGHKIKYVVEAIGEGVVHTDLVTHLTTKDRLAILRPKRPNVMNAVVEAEKLIGIPYDFEFSPGDTELYCSELVGVVYPELIGEYDRYAITPDDIFESDHVTQIIKYYVGE